MAAWEAISGRKSVDLLDEKREVFVVWRGFLSSFLSSMFLSFYINV